jgi:hypothetical protein
MEYKMSKPTEKYGFVYIWYDSKRKMFYIGCHWGTENDGYICSSNRMRNAYRRRPEDFKRRIISNITSNRTDLLEEEYKWLQLIPKDQLGKKYYNLKTHHYGHWTNNEQSRLTVSQKIKKSQSKPEYKKIVREQKLGDKNPMKRPEVIAKRLESYNKKEHIPWNKGLSSKNDKRVLNNILKVSELNKERIWFHNPETGENYFTYISNFKPPPSGFIPKRKIL